MSGGAGWASVLAGLLAAAAALLSRPVLSRPVLSRPVTGSTPERDRPAPAGPRGAMPAVVMADLVAALLSAGLPPESALRVLRRCLDEAGLEEPPALDALLDALRLAQDTGIAPTGLVRAAAAEQRRAQAAAHSLAARRLGVLIVLPMGLCLLPAFVLLTVAPLVLALLTG